MNNLNWEFFEAYKGLDELCKQILSCEGSGVSQYIDEMSKDKQGRMLVKGWEQDYKQLKRMRWIRNQLAHESNSFEENLVTVQDLEWVKEFRNHIMECTDPFSLLHQRENKNKRENIKRQSPYIEEVNQVNEFKNYNRENESEDWMKGIFYALLIGFLIGTGIVVLIGIYFRI